MALEWQGDRPYFLLIRQYIDDMPSSTVVDLDESTWMETYAHLMRVPGVWMLCDKERSQQTGVPVPIFIIQVEEGEQPYFVLKHVKLGLLGGGDQAETLCWGIGKKRRDGFVDRLWLLPNGSVTVGEDVYWVADRMNKGKL